ncbi:hypothetical protein ACFX19_002473 [Malus domestica]
MDESRCWGDILECVDPIVTAEINVALGKPVDKEGDQGGIDPNGRDEGAWSGWVPEGPAPGKRESIQTNKPLQLLL